MCPGHLPGPELVEHHRRMAAGGVGLTTVAYASVSYEGLTYEHQICMRQVGIGPALRRITDAVHAEGAAASIQLGHAGYFAATRVIGRRPMGPSAVFNLYDQSLPRAMQQRDIAAVTEHFVRAARAAADAGFDAVELQAGHGYLLSQFLSPYTNRRTDAWGGSLENRLRFPIDVLRRVRDALGPRFPIAIKMNLRDGFAGGLELEDAVGVARAFEAGGADALVLSGGFVSKVPMYVMRGEVPFAEMYRGQTSLVKKLGLLLMGRVVVKRFPFTEAYFLEDARAVRAAVKLPLVLVGGLRRLAQMEQVLAEGFDFIALARPLIMEPDLPARMQRGEATASRCEPCNKCIASMDHGAVHCPLAAAQQAPQ
jgi:2,4-dienoyl-CoA reductase-like NADH-dependent reductase (Old Yellow Enzyme family)